MICVPVGVERSISIAAERTRNILFTNKGLKKAPPYPK